MPSLLKAPLDPKRSRLLGFFFSHAGAGLFVIAVMLIARGLFELLPEETVADALKFSLGAGLGPMAGLLAIWSDLMSLDKVTGLRLHERTAVREKTHSQIWRCVVLALLLVGTSFIAFAIAVSRPVDIASVSIAFAWPAVALYTTAIFFGLKMEAESFRSLVFERDTAEKIRDREIEGFRNSDDLEDKVADAFVNAELVEAVVRDEALPPA